MTAKATRSWMGAAASMLLVGLTGLLVLTAGLALVFILPATLVIVAMGYPGDATPAAGLGNWLFLLWFPLAFLAAIYNIVAGLRMIEAPSLGGTAGLLALTLLVFFTFPPFLFPA